MPVEFWIVLGFVMLGVLLCCCEHSCGHCGGGVGPSFFTVELDASADNSNTGCDFGARSDACDDFTGTYELRSFSSGTDVAANEDWCCYKKIGDTNDCIGGTPDVVGMSVHLRHNTVTGEERVKFLVVKVDANDHTDPDICSLTHDGNEWLDDDSVDYFTTVDCDEVDTDETTFTRVTENKPCDTSTWTFTIVATP